MSLIIVRYNYLSPSIILYTVRNGLSTLFFIPESQGTRLFTYHLIIRILSQYFIESLEK